MSSETQSLELVERVRTRTTALYYQNLALGQMTSFLLSGLLAASAGAERLDRGLAWWAAMSILSVARLASGRQYAMEAPEHRGNRLWRDLAVWSSGVAGIGWATGAVLFMRGAPVETQVFVAFVIAGLVAGSVPILAAVRRAHLLFSAPPVLAVAVMCLVQWESPILRLLLGCALLFLAVMARSARTFAQVVTESIQTGIERLHLIEELERSRDAAQAASLAKNRFLATMSHELRTPMNGVLGMAQVLLTPGISGAERDECARTILSSGSVLLAQLNDVLDLSRIEAGKFHLASSGFRPAEVAREIVAVFDGQARQKGVSLRQEWQGAADAMYESDPVRVRQMLMNLVNNAVKFTRQGEVEVVARELAEGGSRWLEFSVRDTGIGISAAGQARLFEPFSQIDSSDTRAFGGSGLGLSIVRQLAQLLGGSAGLESEMGRGSRFWFRIPAVPARPSLPVAPVREDAPPVPSAAAGPLHALIAEDLPVNRKVLEKMLERLGCTSESVEDGEAAVERATGEPGRFAILFMDCQMPRMDGYEATARIRAWEREGGHSRLPIVAVSAAAYQDDIARCLEAGMDDFLAKPLAIDSLGAALAKWSRRPQLANA